MVDGQNYASKKPLVHVTYLVTNDSDSGNVNYWALDQYTQTLNIWATTTPNVYAVNATDVGLACTFSGATSPNSVSITQSYDECATMSGGYNRQLTTSMPAANTMQTTLGSGIINIG